MWKDFPARLCEPAAMRGLVYSRPGYGRSTPRPHGERWAPDFMHVQAREVLPRSWPPRRRRGERPPWLFGHSDGASIALIHAATFPAPSPA
jgi:pimeloyl-ACP methyl ester carboxylesterase